MGYNLSTEQMNHIMKQWSEKYFIYAPKTFIGDGAFSDTNTIRYGQVQTVNEIVFDQKSDYSFKEILLPISQTLFYFTEDTVTEPKVEKTGAIIFLRSCDLHAVKRLDEIYLRNGYEDYYYTRLRSHVKFIVMGCSKAFEHCFCVDMETNQADNYDAGIEQKDGKFYIHNQCNEWEDLFLENNTETLEAAPVFVSDTKTKVKIPDGLTIDVMKSDMWKEYDSRCINCGRCNFVCPTCTCFTMQDIFYTDNERTGERRRVWASCMVDGYTDVAGGGSYRKENGQRMRFKALHKVYDYKKRNGYHMCVGCGRCDDVCPEYISFSNCINKLEDAVKEVAHHE